MERLRLWCDDKLVELRGIADGHCISKDLGQAIDLWGGNEEGEDEDESSSDVNEGDNEGESVDGEDVKNESFIVGILAHKHLEVF